MSTLKVNNLQVGQDSTATNNLTWFQPGSPDGTIRLGSGNAGSATTKFTFDKDGNLTCVGDITANSIIAPIEGTLDDWIVHAGDTNTKFGFPAADTVTVETGGSERARIDSGGRLLVGTTSTNAAVRAVFQGYQGGGDDYQARVQFQTNQATNLATNQHLANLLFTNSSGSVGAEIRAIADAAWGTNDYPGRLEFYTTPDGSNTSTERLRITSGGEVRIGGAGADGGYQLNVVDQSNRTTTAETALLLYAKHDGSGTTGAGFGTGIRFWGDRASGNVEQNMGRIMCIAEVNSGTTLSSAFVFETGVAGVLGEKLRITSAGTLKFTGQNTSLETAGITHHTNNNLYIRGGTSGLVLGNHDNTNTIHISNSDFIKFETTDGSERLRINSTGQLIMTNAATQTFADFSTTNNTTRGLISLAGKDGSGNAVTLKMGGFGDTSRGEIFTHSNHGLGFATNNAATQMILDTSGNLSISPTVYGGGGTSPQLYVRSTSGRQVKIHNPNAGTCSLQMTNSTTGQGEDAGTQLFTQGNSGDFWIQSAYATADIAFATKASGGSTTEKLRIRSGGVVQIGGATENNADIDWSNSKLTIKQSSNQLEDGIYIERSGERRGYYIYVGGALGQNDALGIVSQQLGGDTAVLSIDRGGDIVIGPGNIVMSQGKGISFINAADVASGETVAGSVLDDYEEGTYTPTISNLGNHTATTGSIYGAYTKIGDLVTVRFRYQWTNRSTTNGAYNVILSLPFTGANVKTPGHGSCAVEGCQPNSSDRTSYHSSVPQNAAYVQFRCSGANVSENSFHGGIATSLSTGYFIGVVSYKTT